MGHRCVVLYQVPAVGGDAHDLYRVPVDKELLTDRITIALEPSGHRLVDDHHRWTSIVRGQEVSISQDRYVQRGQVRLVDRVGVDQELWSSGWRLNPGTSIRRGLSDTPIGRRRAIDAEVTSGSRVTSSSS